MTRTNAPAVRLTRKESQEDTRRRLVDAAMTLFSRSGVAATSLNAVAAHAGFTRGAVHGNFAGKEELVAAVAARVTEELGPQLRAVLAESTPSGDRLAAYIRTFLAYCNGNPDSAGALIAVVEHRGRTDRGHYHQRAEASLDDLVELFEDGQRRGEMRAFDPEQMAFAVRTVLDATAARLRATDRDAESTTREIVGLFDAATKRGASR